MIKSSSDIAEFYDKFMAFKLDIILLKNHTENVQVKFAKSKTIV